MKNLARPTAGIKRITRTYQLKTSEKPTSINRDMWINLLNLTNGQFTLWGNVNYEFYCTHCTEVVIHQKQDEEYRILFLLRNQPCCERVFVEVPPLLRRHGEFARMVRERVAETVLRDAPQDSLVRVVLQAANISHKNT